MEEEDLAVRALLGEGVQDRGGRNIRIRSAYLVGADGAASFVRGVIGQDFTGRTWSAPMG